MAGKKTISRFFCTCLHVNYKQLAAIVLGCLLIFLPIFCEKRARRERPCSPPPVANTLEELQLDKAAVEASVDPFLVPNYVHFFRFGETARRLNLIDVLCLLAVFRNQKPDRIFVHTDDVEATTKSFSDYRVGRKLLMEPGVSEVLHFLPYPKPKHVFGVPFSKEYREWHMSDLGRLRILRKYGGIFLDNDVYLLRNADVLRHHELSLTSSTEGVENTVIAAHKDSSLLSSWITSYMHYDQQVSLHHRTNNFLHFLQSFDPKPFIVNNGVTKSDVQRFLNDEIPEHQTTTTLAVNLNTHPRDGLAQLDYLHYIQIYGQDFVDRYFRLDDDTRKRVNFVTRNLFDNLSD